MGVSRFDCSYEIRERAEDILGIFGAVILTREDNPMRGEIRYSVEAGFVPDVDYVTMQMLEGYRSNWASLSIEFLQALPPLSWPLSDVEHKTWWR